jgi:hypothetical protein
MVGMVGRDGSHWYPRNVAILQTAPINTKGNKILVLGIDGCLVQLPVAKQFTGDVVTDEKGRPIGCAPPPVEMKPWDPVQLAVVDLWIFQPFQSILGDGSRPCKGPA